MAAVDDLKAAGFDDAEIGTFVGDKAKALTEAGFSTQEVTQYLGVAPALEQPKRAHGMGQAWEAGYQRSLAGLIDRNALPDIVIDGKENPWQERWAANVATMFHEAPEGIAGAMLGAMAGSPAGPVGAVIAGGAGSMYLPAVIRESYAKAIRDGQITSKADWMSRIGIALRSAGTAEVQKQAGKEAAVGAALGGVGKVTGPIIGKVTSSTAVKVGGTIAAEIGTAAIVPAALEGRLPETHEFIDAATIVAGFKAVNSAPAIARRLSHVYEKTGKTPAEVLGDAAGDPTITQDLVRGTEAETVLRAEMKKQGVHVQEIDPASMDLSIFDIPGTEPAWKPPVDAVEPAAVQAGKRAAKIAVKQEFDAGGIPEQAAFRGLSVAELQEIAETGRLPIGRNAEGEAVISATPVIRGEFEGAAYGAGSGYVVPRDRTTASGLAGEVHVDPHTDPRQLKYVVNGQVLSFDQMKAEMLGPTGKRPKSAETLAAEAELRKLLGEDDVPRAYRQQAADMAAQEAFPGDKARTVVDSPMAELPQAKLPHQMNLRYVEAPSDVQALLTRMSEVYRGEIDAQRNGTKTWEQTAADARAQLGEMLGPDAQRILAGREGGDAVSNVEIKIRSDLLMQATLDTSARLEALRKAGPDASPELRAQALESVHKLSMIQALLTGAAAEAGRALQQMKAVKSLRDQGADIARLYEMYGRDPDTLLKMLGDAQTPEQLGRLVREYGKATSWQKFIEFYRASLMSGFLTVGYNVAGNATFLAQRNFLVEPGAALVGAITRSSDRVTATEVAARWYGSLIVAPMSMVQAGARAIKNEGWKGPALAAWEAGQEVAPGPVVNVGVVGKFTKAVYGTNSMLDAMFRTLTEQGEMYSLATKDAIKQGHEPGTMDFFREVKSRVENPTDAMLEVASKAGERAVFATPMGELGKKFAAFADASKIGRFVVPFQQTPTNIIKETFRNSPFAPLVEGWRADVAKGGAARDKAVAEMAVGTALFTAAILLASQGKITGSLDPDPKKRAVQMQAGKQPYSYVTDDGAYIPLVRLAPTMGTMIGMAADIVQLSDYMEPDEQYKLGKMGMLTFKNAVTNQTMLAGITNVLKAMDDENSLAKWVNSTAGSLVPASGMLGQIAALKDPYQREVYGMLDSIRMKVPGAREMNQPRLDAWGQEVLEVERPLFIAPVKVTKQSEDKVRNEAARLGVGAAKPPKTVDVGISAGRVGMVELTPEQKTQFARDAGELAYRIAEPVVNSARWDSTPDLVQRQIMQDALEAGRQFAKSQVFTPEQLKQEIQTRSARLRELLQPK